MTRLRLAAAALNTTPLDWQGNLRLIRAALDGARAAQAAIVCLPELCVTGYGCEDMFLSTGVQETALALLPELAAESRGLMTCFGLPVNFEGAIYNGVAVACDGQLLGIVAKQHLAGDGIHYEPRWFRSWPAAKVAAIEIAGKPYPLGDLLFDCGGVRIGLEICRDAWLPNRTGLSLVARGADLILNPSASHFAFAKQKIRDKFVLEAAEVLGVSFAYCNLLGNEAGRAIYDGGTMIASEGRIVARGPRFSFADWLLTSAVIDVGAARQRRAEKSPATLKPTQSGGVVSVEFRIPVAKDRTESVQILSGICPGSAAVGPAVPVATSVPGHPEWESGPFQKEEEFARAVSLALFDYVRKSQAKGCVVSLSGGADSSAVATFVHLLVQFGVRELGSSRFLAKLPQLARRLSQSAGQGWSEHVSKQIVGELLTCVYQATRNNGEVTLNAARRIAEAVGAKFLHWNIDEFVEGYVNTVSAAVGRPLDWERDDVALQNIQARARGPGAWMLANLQDSLLLTTSNRSEAAVGYATMDGDTCGGLAPIAGIDKAFLLEWLKWLEKTGPAGVGPLPVLALINSQTPTAELRPPADRQTDEGDLMPYRVLDAIERAAIRDKLLPIAVWEAVRPHFPEYPPRQMATWVERFFRLWCRNQWKRERYAPSFHLDDENLDPKTWCRFPILNSGYEQELVELHLHTKRLGH